MNDAFDSGFAMGLNKSKKKPSSGGKTGKLGKDIKSDLTEHPSLKKGGKIKKTGLYRLHKGETVVPAKKGRKKISRKTVKR